MTKYKYGIYYVLFFLVFLIGIEDVKAQKHTLKSEGQYTIIKDSTFQITNNIEETHLQYINQSGDSIAVYILKARLKKGKIDLQVGTPFNKDTITRQTVLKQMQYKNKPDQKVIAGINADFFNMKTGASQGVVVMNRKILRDSILPDKSFIGVKRNGRIIIGDFNVYEKNKKRLKSALGGHPILIENGEIVYDKWGKTKHPRTAIGVNGREVYFVVVDGRQPKHSNGMVLAELAFLMKLIGAKDAINLDGGGSSTFVTFDVEKSKLVVKNKPSDGKPRAVANTWTIIVKN